MPSYRFIVVFFFNSFTFSSSVSLQFFSVSVPLLSFHENGPVGKHHHQIHRPTCQSLALDAQAAWLPFARSPTDRELRILHPKSAQHPTAPLGPLDFSFRIPLPWSLSSPSSFLLCLFLEDQIHFLYSDLQAEYFRTLLCSPALSLSLYLSLSFFLALSPISS